jgi:hypothetical protein
MEERERCHSFILSRPPRKTILLQHYFIEFKNVDIRKTTLQVGKSEVFIDIKMIRDFFFIYFQDLFWKCFINSKASRVAKNIPVTNQKSF